MNPETPAKMTLESQLEALLFWKGEPMAQKKICAILGCTSADLDNALTSLDTTLATRGLRIMCSGEGANMELEMRTAPEMSTIIEKLTKEELMRDLGKAGLETLSIILYKNPIKRSDIDYIRGVNSSFIIRNLLVRGLIERLTDKDGQGGVGRGYTYKPSIDLLAHIGIAKIDDLPEYGKVKAELEAFAQQDAQPETAPVAPAAEASASESEPAQ